MTIPISVLIVEKPKRPKVQKRILKKWIDPLLES